MLMMQGVFLKDMKKPKRVARKKKVEVVENLCDCGEPYDKDLFIPTVIERKGGIYIYEKLGDKHYCSSECIQHKLKKQNLIAH